MAKAGRGMAVDSLTRARVVYMGAHEWVVRHAKEKVWVPYVLEGQEERGRCGCQCCRGQPTQRVPYASGLGGLGDT